MQPSPFGKYIRDKRREAHLSLRAVAEQVGFSHVYLGEVERGRRRSIPEEHWKALASAIPGVTVAGLRAAAADSAPLDPTTLEGQHQEVVVALARRLERDDLTKADMNRLLEILDKKRSRKRGAK